jgi:hypothetical protein
LNPVKNLKLNAQNLMACQRVSGGIKIPLNRRFNFPFFFAWIFFRPSPLGTYSFFISSSKTPKGASKRPGRDVMGS